MDQNSKEPIKEYLTLELFEKVYDMIESMRFKYLLTFLH